LKGVDSTCQEKGRKEFVRENSVVARHSGEVLIVDKKKAIPDVGGHFDRDHVPVTQEEGKRGKKMVGKTIAKGL